MSQRPTVRVRRRASGMQSPALPANDTAAAAAISHADAVLMREIGGSSAGGPHLPMRRTSSAGSGGVVGAIASKHKAALERREEERRQRRMDRFNSIAPIPETTVVTSPLPLDTAAAAAAPVGSPTPAAVTADASTSASIDPESGLPRSRSTGLSGTWGRSRRRSSLLSPSTLSRQSTGAQSEDEHTREAVDVLDVIDARVGTVAVLGDIARSIFVPASMSGADPIVELPTPEERVAEQLEGEQAPVRPGTLRRKTTMHLDGEAGDDARLDDHVQHVLSKREQRKETIKRVLAGVWIFMKTPLGIIVSIYGFLVVFTGAALVICLFGWVPGNKDLQVEAFSQAINGLFTITGIGLAPMRIRDTYRMSRICHYRNLTARLRRERGLPPLPDREDLADEALRNEEAHHHPDPSKHSVAADGSVPGSNDGKPEGDEERESFELPSIEHDHEHVLKPRQAAKLRELQDKFAASATWYRYTETSTHRATRIASAVSVCALNVGNSVFQAFLCGVMWGYAGPNRYKSRPAWTTALGIVCSFSCGIAAAVLIALISKESKKTKEVEDRLVAAFEKDDNAEHNEEAVVDDAEETQATPLTHAEPESLLTPTQEVTAPLVNKST